MWEFFSKGGPVMYPLAACSIIALSVIIDRTIFWIALALRRKPVLAAEILDMHGE